VEGISATTYDNSKSIIENLWELSQNEAVESDAKQDEAKIEGARLEVVVLCRG
jgi:hypothetical protein